MYPASIWTRVWAGALRTGRMKNEKRFSKRGSNMVLIAFLTKTRNMEARLTELKDKMKNLGK
jgi:hypothetical protein